MFLRYFLAWFPMVLIAILNGVLRQVGYARFLSELRAHQISSFTGILLLGLYIFAITSRWRLDSAVQAWSVGAMWLVLTLAFEFLFGHYAMGNSWSRLFADYNLLRGRLWSLVLGWVTAAPYVFFRLHGSS